jgi:hypothetical protein
MNNPPVLSIPCVWSCQRVKWLIRRTQGACAGNTIRGVPLRDIVIAPSHDITPASSRRSTNRDSSRRSTNRDSSRRSTNRDSSRITPASSRRSTNRDSSRRSTNREVSDWAASVSHCSYALLVRLQAQTQGAQRGLTWQSQAHNAGNAHRLSEKGSRPPHG